MIPLSRDQKLRKTIDGVTYIFIPPVGDLEIELISMTSKDDYEYLPGQYEKATQELEEEYVGKRKPKKDKWEELIKQKILEDYKEEDVLKKRAGEIDALINKVLIGWEGEDVIPFPDNNPSSNLPFVLKSKLYNWYQGQWLLEEGELKNL